MNTLKNVTVQNVLFNPNSDVFLSIVNFVYNPETDPSEFEIFEKPINNTNQVFKLYMIVSDGANSTHRRKASLHFDIAGPTARNYMCSQQHLAFSVYSVVRSKCAGTFTEKRKVIPEPHQSRGSIQTVLGSYDLESNGDEYSFTVDVSFINFGEDCAYYKHALFVIMSPPTSKSANKITWKNSFLSPFACLLDNPMNSDVTLKANGREWPVHKCNLSARSPVFAAMFNGNLKESTANSVEIEDVDSNAFDLMIKYIYKNEVEDMQNLEEKLLYLADRYDLPDLKKICEGELIKKLNFQNCLSLLLTGMKFNVESLVGRAKSFITKNFLRLCRTEEWQRFAEGNIKLSVDLTIAYSRTVDTK